MQKYYFFFRAQNKKTKMRVFLIISMRPNLGPHSLKGLAVTSLSENLE